MALGHHEPTRSDGGSRARPDSFWPGEYQCRPYNVRMICYRPARIDDLDPISHFTDWWISGRGQARNVPGAVNDCFITKKQHTKYILKYDTLLAFRGVFVVGWAVKANNDTLIHLLVSGPYRGKGIGKAMVLILQPKFVRSKSDQSTGNPIGFYEKLGYTKLRSETGKARFDFDPFRSLKARNIDVFVRSFSGSFTKKEVLRHFT